MRVVVAVSLDCTEEAHNKTRSEEKGWRYRVSSRGLHRGAECAQQERKGPQLSHTNPKSPRYNLGPPNSGPVTGSRALMGLPGPIEVAKHGRLRGPLGSCNPQTSYATEGQQ